MKIVRDKFIDALKKHKMIEGGNGVIVGLSGGADSVLLLKLLLEISESYNLQIFAVHINHQIRGEFANFDQQFVENLCAELGVQLFVVSANVPQIAKDEKITIEEAGRNVRYSAFSDVLEKTGANKIAVGHHKNDNAETLIMRFFRGTGLAGLAGIPHVRGNIIRPLLDLSKQEILEACESLNLKFVQDETNEIDDYTRNFIRLKLIKLVEENLNSTVINALGKTAEICRDDNEFIENIAKTAYENCKFENCANVLVVDKLNELHISIKRRVFRLAIGEFIGLQNVSFEHIEKLVENLGKKSGKIVNLPHGSLAENSNGLIYLQQNAKYSNNFCYNLPYNNEVDVVEANIKIMVYTEKNEKISKDYCTKMFYCDKITKGLQIRNRKDGDKIFVEKMGGHKKLSKYFSDQKIKRSERDKIALLVDGSNVLWIFDEKSIASDHYKAENDCENVFYVTIMEGNL